MTDHPPPPAPDDFPPAATPKPLPRGAFAFILITLLLDVMSLGIIIPVWPALIIGFTGSSAGAGWWVGISGTTWALMQFFFQPIGGALSDRFGRRPVILFSNLGTGIDYLIMALAPSLWWLLAGRVVSGITAASVSTAFAYVADVSAPHQRAKRFGFLGAVFGLGFILGPVIGAVLGDSTNVLPIPGTHLILHGGPRIPFFVAGAFSVLNFSYGFFILPESLSKERRDKFRWKRANPLGSFDLLKSHKDLLPLAFLQLLAQFAHYVLQTVFTLYAASRYHWGPNQIGLCLATIGVCGVVVQGGLVGPLVKWLGERTAMIVGLTCGAVGFAIYGLAPTWEIFMIGVPVMSLWGLAGASAQSLMSRRVSEQEQGKLQGANAALGSIAGMFAPFLYGATYALFNGRFADLGLPGAPFFLASGFLFGALVLSIWAARDAGRRDAIAAAK